MNAIQNLKFQKPNQKTIPQLNFVKPKPNWKPQFFSRTEPK